MRQLKHLRLIFLPIGVLVLFISLIVGLIWRLCEHSYESGHGFVGWTQTAILICLICGLNYLLYKGIFSISSMFPIWIPIIGTYILSIGFVLALVLSIKIE